ncbi:polysaccharide biosynthesis tyrosine autokinase [Photobacterium carnosum]|uniref:polysaccharide biosynthesis tyrosine autokinase n=1 Tax=Photobacterium carnosum TaxID=2023717 RepID=UPI001E50BF85|nr:polysaccharide biosynthesis tyrosine autokinase [Photobacterium carnosum]MCD9547951.1 polysaccharide biosynthesis tyrosine autokinase [Photobacterium carnosum]MCF2305200.1 polysaccharide biosynthesis tyrosine autokinase [Photobacterium carnosum]
MSEIQKVSIAANNKVDDIDFGKLFGSLVDAKWYIIAITAIFCVVGIIVALLSTPIYKADALIQVEQKQTGGIGALVSSNMGEMFDQDSSSSTETAIIRSRMVLGETVDDLALTTVVTPHYLPYIGKGLARLQHQQTSINVGHFVIPDNMRTAAITLVITEIDSNNYTKGRYEVTNAQGNILFKGKTDQWSEGHGYRLYVTDLNGKANDSFTINKLARFSAIQQLKANLTITEVGKQTGILELTFTGEDPAKIEQIVNSISQNYLMQNIVRNSAEAEKSLVFLEQQLPKIKDKLTIAEDKLNAYRSKNDSIDLDLEARAKLQAMVQLDGQLNELVFKESEVSQRFTQEHPMYIALNDKRGILNSEKKRLEKQIQKLPETQRAVLRLMRDVQVSQQIYLQMLNKSQELSIVKAGTVGNVRIVDKAQDYFSPIAPKKSLIVASFTVVGFMLVVTIILGFALFKRRIESPAEIEAIGLPVYASIPMSDSQIELEKTHNKRHKNQQHLSDCLLAKFNPADLSIEALRSLRTSLHFAMMEAKNNILMISGPSPSVGKSFVTANMATVIANSGCKILVIDGDMRKGRMASQFGLNKKLGLSDYLSGQKTTAEIIKHPDIDNVDYISSGDYPPNPSELLMHPRFKALMEWAAEHYDMVLIDTPPLLAVTDAAIVGAHAGTTLLVGRFGETTVREVEITKQRFEQNGIEVKGFILNGVLRKASSYYGGNYGYYNYSYADGKK